MSDVDIGLWERAGRGVKTWSLVEACGGMAASEPGTVGPWSLEVGRAKDAGNVGPILATFKQSDFTGDPPYLIEVVISADLTATIRQQKSLPSDPTSRYC